jgi:tRNA threonylcarbamoyladenosine biosynthesis protein TsaE
MSTPMTADDRAPLAPLTITSDGAAATRRLGHHLGRAVRGGDIVLLDGDLGAGKTTLAQGIAAGLGVEEAVTSPTFTLINEYAATTATGQPVVLYHIDLYRLEATDTAGLGIEEILGAPDSIVVVEWPGRAPALGAESALLVRIGAAGADRRRVDLAPIGPPSRRLADLLADLRRALPGASHG